MKKKLLLTTALVAFSAPALAATYTSEQAITSSQSGVYTVKDSNTKRDAQNVDINSPLGVLWVNRGATMTVEGGSVFENNHAESGTIYVSMPRDGNKAGLVINGTSDNKVYFTNNEAYFDGGAIASMGDLSVSNAVFSGNRTNNTTGVVDSMSIGGGAIALGAEANSKLLSIDSTLFENNASGTNGGAIGTRLGANADNSAAKLDVEATFTGNSAANNGGAIYNTFYANNGLDKGEGVTVKGVFKSNSAGNNGGAIYNDGSKDNWGNGVNGGVMTILSGSEFENNSSKVDGGAIYNTGDLTINEATFKNNVASAQSNADYGYGGAIFSNGHGLNIDKTNFTGNKAVSGGAVYESRYSTYSADNADGMVISNSNFTNNYAAADGGALGLANKSKITDTVFTGNHAGLTVDGIITAVTDSNGGGAIMFNEIANSTMSKVEFYGNKSGAHGGAIASRHTTAGSLSIDNAIFDGNEAAKEGGAIASIYNGAITISNSSFTNNKAGTNGGAIYVGKADNYAGFDGTLTESSNGGILNLSGTNIFSGNTANGQSNDIYNTGTINVSGNLTLDGGIAGTGIVNFLDKSVLTINLGKTTIAANEVNITNSKLIFDNDVTEKTYDFITAEQTGNFIIDVENSLYNIEHKGDGKIYVEVKSTDELASSLDATSNEANALLAVTSNTTSSTNQAFTNVAKKISQLAQLGDTSAAKEASKLGASSSPVVSGQETSVQNALFNVVSTELNGGTGAIAQGKSSGDYLKKATAWIRGLFNKADAEKTNKSAGFTSDTYGVAMGVDSEINSDTRLGLGYANSQTDVDSEGRSTDIDTNTLFVYSKYQPSDWYINTMLAYSWSKYDEKSSVLGENAGAKYDVDTLALQAMYGYETYYKCYDITPEFGLRYMHINQDAYTNKLGSKVAKNTDDVLTAVAGVKVARNYRLSRVSTLRPEFKAAVTYDLFEADNSANVLLANGAAYKVNGDSLNRLGFEVGGKLTTNLNEKLEVSAEYMARLREDYQDHTLMFDAKYNF